ncbi:MAG TPA: DUF3089 domain-containing protein [Caulobacteraceae bacterium]|jgi:hypothetical protein
MLKSCLAALCGMTMLAGAAQAQPPQAQPAPVQPALAAAPETYPPNDYANPANWLCWPGRHDACASDLTTTVVRADGSTSVEPFHADPDAPIDCFYVYPTVSRDPGMFATMKIEPEETNVVIQQAARLAAKCRLYAPMYRQFTLTALTAAMTHPPKPGAAAPPRQPVGFNDVKDAWAYYMAHENHGRGVVLVGHSQGSGVLIGLIGAEIDGKPQQASLVSAILMGAPLAVPQGKLVGGDFKSIPLCTSATQLGCVIDYSSFRETSPPPENSRFGRPRSGGAGLEAACVNPANLDGGAGPAKAYFGALIAAQQAQPFPWLKGKTIDTPFVSVPGLITARCVRTGPFHYLAIHLNADPASPRTSDIPGDIVVGGYVLKDWGLHLIDANLFMGNLVDIVGEEGAAWKARGK